MASEKLKEYIKRSLEKGSSEEEITNNLLSVGWRKEDIEETFLFIQEVNQESVEVEEVKKEVVEELAKSTDQFSEDLTEKINFIQNESAALENKKLGEMNDFSTKKETAVKLIDKPEVASKINKLLPKILIIIALFLLAVMVVIMQKDNILSFFNSSDEIALIEPANEENITQDNVEENLTPIDIDVPLNWICGEELVDERDGNRYATVKINSQCWMSSNLNYKTENSLCYGSSEDNCINHGALYNWNEAMYACPLGWSLPTDDDFKMVESYLGMSEANIHKTGWREVLNNPKSLLNISFSGSRESSGEFEYINEYANFWLSSSEGELHSARSFRNKNNDIYRGASSGDYGYSVRCVKY